MIWNDKGYLLSKNKYNENSIIAEVYSKNHGKVSGVIFGASSKKIKNYLLVGNKLHLNFNSKNDGRTGYLKVEIDSVTTPIYLDNKKKLSCIIYAMSILKLLTVENQKNINIYLLIDHFFEILKNNNWIKNFILWELQILKNIGYDIDFKNYVSNEIINGVDEYVVKSNYDKRIIPNFLINKKKNPKNNEELFKGLKLVGDYLNKTILKPNNINFPISRINFVNLLKY